MARSTLFNFRVLRCPNCSATLPVESGKDMVTCEYCDAHIHVARTKAAPPPPRPTLPEQPAPPSNEYTASPQVSVIGWLMFSVVLMMGISGLAFAIVMGQASEGLSEFLEANTPQPVIASSQLGDGPASEPPAEPAPKKKKTKRPKKAKPKPEPAPEPTTEQPAKPLKPKVKKVARPKLPEPTGPVLSVSDAEKAIEGAIKTCMRQQGLSNILAYMGNSKVGAVKVLDRYGTRVDGVRKKIKGTTLGRCMDKAGATVRVRAFKSNYLRFHLVNDAVKNPHGHLPKKHDRKAYLAIIDGAEDKIRACAKKHGEEGARAVFYFKIDGPSGKPERVDESYLSKSFKRCAEPVYKKLEFPKVQEWTIKITKNLQL